MDKKLLYVLAEAVDAYKAAGMRGRNYVILGYKADQLLEMYPEHYARHSNGKVKFVGKTADDILEDYLSELGYDRGSRRWHQLVSSVIDICREGD
jgi:hypothetical protein|tara:strand:+ start:495 stop:779 length:285 start_codon:yes stop_codon:yes gene_type:complete